jgi:hypothetical protein
MPSRCHKGHEQQRHSSELAFGLNCKKNTLCYRVDSAECPSNPDFAAVKYRLRSPNATLTRPMKAGTSTSGPTTPTKASPDLSPKTATATAIAS